MRGLMMALLLGLALPAMAGSTVSFGRKVLSVGNSVARVYEVAGQPDRVVNLQNRYGAGVGQRLEYFRDGKTVMITIADGQIVRIEERR